METQNSHACAIYCIFLAKGGKGRGRQPLKMYNFLRPPVQGTKEDDRKLFFYLFVALQTQ
jgi:hypothetical protein